MRLEWSKEDRYGRKLAKVWVALIPQIGPWFVGRAKLIVQGIRLDDGQFLALRIVGGTEPQGPPIWSFRENPGEAEEPALDGAPQRGWTVGRDRQTSNARPLVNVTSTEPAGHDGNLVEVLNPTFPNP